MNVMNLRAFHEMHVIKMQRIFCIEKKIKVILSPPPSAIWKERMKEEKRSDYDIKINILKNKKKY